MIHFETLYTDENSNEILIKGWRLYDYKDDHSDDYNDDYSDNKSWLGNH